MKIVIKRVYESPSEEDGNRILVDKLWPRGIAKDDAQLNEWWKDVAPSAELRKWFAHDPRKWDGFKNAYLQELDENREEIHKLLQATDRRKKLTLLYAAKDKEHNHAIVLKEYITGL